MEASNLPTAAVRGAPLRPVGRARQSRIRRGGLVASLALLAACNSAHVVHATQGHPYISVATGSLGASTWTYFKTSNPTCGLLYLTQAGPTSSVPAALTAPSLPIPDPSEWGCLRSGSPVTLTNALDSTASAGYASGLVEPGRSVLARWSDGTASSVPPAMSTFVLRLRPGRTLTALAVSTSQSKTYTTCTVVHLP